MKTCRLCSGKVHSWSWYGVCQACLALPHRERGMRNASTGGLDFSEDEEMPHVGGGRHRRRDYPYAMTYQEIGARLGICWQRVQQIEQGALAKIRNNPELMAALMGAH